MAMRRRAVRAGSSGYAGVAGNSDIIRRGRDVPAGVRQATVAGGDALPLFSQDIVSFVAGDPAFQKTLSKKRQLVLPLNQSSPEERPHPAAGTGATFAAVQRE